MSKKVGKLTLEDWGYIAKVKQIGCIVNPDAGDDYCEGFIEYHHITSCGRRLGHRIGIPLCSKHHRYGKISIGNAKKSFVAKYGTEMELLEKVNEIF